MPTPADLIKRWSTRLAPLEFHARSLVDGSLAGKHLTHKRGRSGEFVDRRSYVPGDDRRRMDWKIFARNDRLTVRESRDDSNLPVTLLLDVSLSMGYPEEGVSKRRFSSELLSALGWLLLRRGEPTGVGFFDHRLLSFHAPRTGPDRLGFVLSQLDTPPVGEKSGYGGALKRLGSQLTRRGVTVVATDGLGVLDDVLTGFRALRVARQEPVMFQVLDPTERSLDGMRYGTFRDAESLDRLTVDPASLAPAYGRRMEVRQKQLVRGLSSVGADHFLFSTDASVEEQLALFLRRRETRLP